MPMATPPEAPGPRLELFLAGVLLGMNAVYYLFLVSGMMLKGVLVDKSALSESPQTTVLE